MKIENVVHDKKKIFPNVDFYAAVVLNTLGVSKEFFTPFFASSRISQSKSDNTRWLISSNCKVNCRKKEEGQFEPSFFKP
jgi:hypothetical protein